MFIPEFFWGKFSDVEKRFKLLKSKKKKLENLQSLYDIINQNMNDEIYHENFVISLSDDYISRKMQNAYYPFIFSNYITFEEDDDSDITNWFKEKSLVNKWCQLSALASNSLVQFLYDDKNYAKKLGDSICANWNYYMSYGECFCFLPIGNKPNNKYFFWENNLALSKLIVSITGKDSISLEDFEKFPSIWKKCTSKFDIC